MSDWATRNLPNPCAFIQWKGTDVCADYYCVCGIFFHVDAEFAYAVQCPTCKRRYEVSAMIELREMAADEVWGGCEIIQGDE
jgi:hypothetical protein